MKSRSYASWVALAWILIAVSSIGCGSSSKDSDDELTLALNWYPDAQHGGFYAAVVNGFYEEEGLNVKIVPGGPNVPVIEKVSQGRATFGVSNADQILVKRNQDAKVVALMAPLQNSPRCIMVHKATGIERFEDLRDLTLALGPGRSFAEYMKKHTDLNGVRVVNYSGTVTRFLTDERFAQQGYVFSEPFVAQQAGAETHCLMVSDIGFNPYTSCLFTNEEFIEENPEIVRRFVRATVKGWQAYLEDPEPINKVIHEANPEMDLASLKFAAEAIKPLCLPNEMTDEELGEMSDERWTKLVSQLKDIEHLPDEFELKGAYRVDFLKRDSDLATD